MDTKHGATAPNYSCVWVSALGIPFSCCEDCHERGLSQTIVTPQGTHIAVCCNASQAYLDYNGPMLADPRYGVARYSAAKGKRK